MARRFQFSLESILLVTAWVAVACAVGGALWPAIWRPSKPMPWGYWLLLGMVASWALLVLLIGVASVSRAYRRLMDSQS